MRAGMLALTVVLILLEWPGVQPPAEPEAWSEIVTVRGYVCEPARRTSSGQLAFVLCTAETKEQCPPGSGPRWKATDPAIGSVVAWSWKSVLIRLAVH